MRIVVLGAAESWYTRDLLRAAEGRHELHVAPFSEVAAEIDDDGARIRSGETDLLAADAVLVRTMPPGSLEQVVMRMDVLMRLSDEGVLVVNPPKAIEAAVDKFLATSRLQQAGLPTPRTIVCQTVDETMTAFEQLGGDVVVKPLFGGEGRGIYRADDPSLALRAAKMICGLGGVAYLQPFLEHEGFDLRLLVLGDRVWGMKRSNPLDWRTNISRGAVAEAFQPNDELCELAKQSTAAIGAVLAGVDVLPTRDGRRFVLEVNGVPGWKALAQATAVDVAAEVLAFLERRVEATRTGGS